MEVDLTCFKNGHIIGEAACTPIKCDMPTLHNANFHSRGGLRTLNFRSYAHTAQCHTGYATSNHGQSSFDSSCDASGVVGVGGCVRGTCAVPETSNVVSPVDSFLNNGGSLTASCKAGYWFIWMFVLSIGKAEKRGTKEERFAELFRSFLSLLFIRVSRSLLLYSFMLCLKCKGS